MHVFDAMALRSRNLLLVVVISSDASDYSAPLPSFRRKIRAKLSSLRGAGRGGEVCAWLEVKTFAYPLPYLEHVGLRRRPARQIASSIFNKALKGPRGFVERRYKVNFDVGQVKQSVVYRE